VRPTAPAPSLPRPPGPRSLSPHCPVFRVLAVCVCVRVCMCVTRARELQGRLLRPSFGMQLNSPPPTPVDFAQEKAWPHPSPPVLVRGPSSSWL